MTRLPSAVAAILALGVATCNEGYVGGVASGEPEGAASSADASAAGVTDAASDSGPKGVFCLPPDAFVVTCPVAGTAAGLPDDAVRGQLLVLAEQFEREADAALAFEGARSETSTAAGLPAK